MPAGELSRRGFLGGAAALSVTPFIPKSVGAKEVVFRAPPPVATGNTILAPDQIAREAMAILESEIEADITEMFKSAGPV